MSRITKTGAKPERDALRQEMLAAGCAHDLIAQEMERRWGFRPREAHRHALGCSQDQIAARFTDVAERLGADRGAPPMIGTRIGEYERWPHGGRRPSAYVLTLLAAIYGTTVDRLLDYDDYRNLPDQDRTVLSALLLTASGGTVAPQRSRLDAVSATPPAPLPPPATATPAAPADAERPTGPALPTPDSSGLGGPDLPSRAPATSAAAATGAAAATSPARPSSPAAQVDAPPQLPSLPGIPSPTPTPAPMPTCQGEVTEAAARPAGTPPTGWATVATVATAAAPTSWPAPAVSPATALPKSRASARRRSRDELLDRATGTLPVEDEVISAAAAQSAAFGEWAEATNVGPTTLEQFDQDVRRIGHDYLRGAPLPLLLSAILVRNRAFTLLEGRQHVNQSRALYVVAGRACGLLAWMSGDIGHTAEAETQARTGWLCAELSGNDGLRAWIRATQSKLAYWDGRIWDSAQLAEAAAQYGASDSARVLLACLAARAHARLGRAEEAHAALARAAVEREALRAPDEVGGLYGFSEAQQSYLAGTTYLWLREPAEALRAADRAVWLYETGAPDQRFYGAEMLALIDGAAAQLQAGELDGAAERLDAVLDLPPERRLETVTQRLGEVRDVLRGGRYARSTVSVEMQQRIEEFRAGALSQQLSR